MRDDIARAYTRELMEQLTGERPSLDEDGDLRAILNGQQFWVRIGSGADVSIRVFSQAAVSIDARDPGLLDALNDLNATGPFARWWSSGEVMSLAIDIWADDLNPANLHHACSVITSAAERFGPDLHERFGTARSDGAVHDAVASDPTPLVAAPDVFTGPPLSPLPTLRAEASPYL